LEFYKKWIPKRKNDTQTAEKLRKISFFRVRSFHFREVNFPLFSDSRLQQTPLSHLLNRKLKFLISPLPIVFCQDILYPLRNLIALQVQSLQVLQSVKNLRLKISYLITIKKQVLQLGLILEAERVQRTQPIQTQDERTQLKKTFKQVRINITKLIPIQVNCFEGAQLFENGRLQFGQAVLVQTKLFQICQALK